MSFTYISDVNNVQENSTQAEVNSLVKNKLRNGKQTEEIEIFSKMVWGKDVSKYGNKVDKVHEAFMKLASAADEGDTKAKAEINSIVTVTLQQPLMQRLQVNNMLGNATTVGYGEQLRFEYYQMQGEMSRDQATSGAFVMPTVKKKTDYVDTHTVSGGLAIDYREMASGATDGLAMAAEQIVTSMVNQVVLYNITALSTAIKNASTMKNYTAGITKTSVDAAITKARRFGNVTIMGDYSTTSLINGMSGFGIAAAGTEWRYSEAVMQEIMKTGLVKNYNGTIVVEIPNTYNLTELNTAGDFYKPYLPTTDLWFVPQGQLTPLNMVMRGGLTSMTAQNINDRTEVTVFDLEHGAKVIPQYLPFIGYIYHAATAE